MVSRRHLLTAAGAVALGPLAACSSGSGSGSNTAKDNAGAALPKYIAYSA